MKTDNPSPAVPRSVEIPQTTPPSQVSISIATISLRITSQNTIANPLQNTTLCVFYPSLTAFFVTSLKSNSDFVIYLTTSKTDFQSSFKNFICQRPRENYVLFRQCWPPSVFSMSIPFNYPSLK